MIERQKAVPLRGLDNDRHVVWIVTNLTIHNKGRAAKRPLINELQLQP